nr:GATA transcription factor 1-like [Ipomoea batatas]
MTDDFSSPLTETVPADEIRLKSPNVYADLYYICQKVDAFDNDGWWVGNISRKMGDRYYVYFETTDDEILYHKDRIRIHLDWKRSSFKEQPATPEETTTIGRRCQHCRVDKTPQWRAGPMGPKTLCNACGVRYKSGRLLPEYRPANSPTFSAAVHSNSHRKVLEMRRKKTGGKDGIPSNEACGYRKDMLFEFYKKISPRRSILCAGVNGKRMQMAWRDSRNKIDCGVFLMRHMETYLGQRISNWDCGLVKGDTLKLHKLRMRYMKELSIFEFSIHKSRNLSRAYQSGVCAVIFDFFICLCVGDTGLGKVFRRVRSYKLLLFVRVIVVYRLGLNQ